jgi:hypothetical protein
MVNKKLKKNKELIKYIATEELQQKLSEHNTDMFTEETFQLIRDELEVRQRISKRTEGRTRSGFQGVLVAIVLISVLLVLTNPTKVEYEEYLQKQVIQQNDEKIIKSTNYIIFTVFETNISGDTFRAIGMLKKIFPIADS